MIERVNVSMKIADCGSRIADLVIKNNLFLI